MVLQRNGHAQRHGTCGFWNIRGHTKKENASNDSPPCVVEFSLAAAETRQAAIKKRANTNAAFERQTSSCLLCFDMPSVFIRLSY